MAPRFNRKPCPLCGRFCGTWKRVLKFQVRSQVMIDRALADHPPYCKSCGKPLGSPIPRCYSCASSNRPFRHAPPSIVLSPTD